ncbi:MAG: thioredoxin family protein [Deinococcales bacterium]
MQFLDAQISQKLREDFEGLEQPVELLVLTGSHLVLPGKDATGHQRETLALLKEICDLSDKLSLSEMPLASLPEAREAGITLAPTTVLRAKGSESLNIRFSGIPSGYEFQTLIATIMMIGTGESGLSEESKTLIAQVQDRVMIESFVTPTCPHCPRAVITAFRLAFHNSNIMASGIEASEFPVISQKYRISGVPDTILSAKQSSRVLGGQPEGAFVSALLKLPV